MKFSKFTFIFKTDHGNGRITERVLAETDSRDRASMLRHRFKGSAGLTQMRTCKKVKVLAVDARRLGLFCHLSAAQMGETFNSMDAFAEAIKANPITLRAALSRAYKQKKTKATVRGVTYAYVE